jgi:hypothetical protein
MPGALGVGCVPGLARELSSSHDTVAKAQIADQSPSRSYIIVPLRMIPLAKRVECKSDGDILVCQMYSQASVGIETVQ